MRVKRDKFRPQWDVGRTTNSQLSFTPCHKSAAAPLTVWDRPRPNPMSPFDVAGVILLVGTQVVL